MASVNDDIFDDVIEHRIDLLRFSESVREKILTFLYELRDDIADQISKADIAGVTRTDWRIARQESLIKEVNAIIDSAHRDSDRTMSNELLELSDLEQKFAVGLINSNIAATLASATLTRTDLKNLVSDLMIQGAPSADWWEKQSADLQMQFASQLRIGVAQGETNDELVRRIRGVSTGRSYVITDADGEERTVREYTGGIMDVSTRNATALIRTSVQTLSNAVYSDIISDNEDLMKGQQWHSTLDSRTTIQCQGLDGGMWDFDGDPLPDSPVEIKFPGPPPIHWNCRSVVIPILKSWEDLAGRKIKGINKIPESTRSSMDGQVPETMTYDSWLKTKSEAFQKEKLGPARWELWSSGKLTLADMLDPSGNPLTIDELAKKVGD